MSWVTFSDPQLATSDLAKSSSLTKIPYLKTEQDFDMDDRAVVGNFQYGRLILFLTTKNIFGSQKILVER